MAPVSDPREKSISHRIDIPPKSGRFALQMRKLAAFAEFLTALPRRNEQAAKKKRRCFSSRRESLIPALYRKKSAMAIRMNLPGYLDQSRISGYRCRANVAHIRHSRPDFGLGFRQKCLKPFQVVPSSLESDPWAPSECVQQRT